VIPPRRCAYISSISLSVSLQFFDSGCNAGARANLADEANVKEYERGYKQVAEFLAKYI
jgi:hypothetical protein